MGKLTSFYIAFNDNPNAIYYPGQTVSGSVFVILSAPMDMRAIKVKFHGKAYVHWSESSGSGKNRRTRHYTGRETYFEENIYVLGKGSGGHTEDAKQIPVGQNVFPFNFQLPTNLPCSFEGVHGHVRYFIKASIDKPWKFDHNTKAAFTVLDMLDLNYDPNARMPVTANDSKTLCCLCCASGPIEAHVHLDKTGYVPGEFIMVNGSVDNASSSDMPSTKATLVQQVTFIATNKKRRVSNKVASIDGPGCMRGQSIEWRNERLQIPALPPSLLRYCNIIVIDYRLEFCVVVPSGSINLHVKVPITLGSIPLQGAVPTNVAPPVVTAPPFEPTAPSLPSPPPAMPQPSDQPPVFQPPPPSYASVAGGEVNIRDEDDNAHLMGQTSFAPQYAYYDWSQSAFTYSK